MNASFWRNASCRQGEASYFGSTLITRARSHTAKKQFPQKKKKKSCYQENIVKQRSKILQNVNAKTLIFFVKLALFFPARIKVAAPLKINVFHNHVQLTEGCLISLPCLKSLENFFFFW